MMVDRWISLLQSRRKWTALFVLVLILGGLWIRVSSVPAASVTQGGIPSPREGFMAPDFTLPLLNGDEITLSELRGRPVVLNLWASWCPPCRVEMPALQETYRMEEGKGLEVIALNVTYQDSQRAAAEFVEQFGLTFPIALDHTGEVGRQYQLRALPTTFFIDPEGVIRKVVIGGPIHEATLRSSIQGLFPEGN